MRPSPKTVHQMTECNLIDGDSSLRSPLNDRGSCPPQAAAFPIGALERWGTVFFLRVPDAKMPDEGHPSVSRRQLVTPESPDITPPRKKRPQATAKLRIELRVSRPAVELRFHATNLARIVPCSAASS
jgi:hypothetical protein